MIYRKILLLVGIIISFNQVSILEAQSSYIDWANRLDINTNLTSQSRPWNHTIDSHGNIYVIGINSTNYLIKLDSLGNELWETTFSSHFAQIYTLDIDNDDNYYLTGIFHGETDFDFRETSEYLLTPEKKSFFIAKYNSEGAVIWVHTGKDHIDIKDVEIYDNGDFLISSNFQYEVNIGMNGETQMISAKTVHPNTGPRDLCVAKYNQNGQLLGHIAFGASGNDKLAQAKLAANGNILVAGTLETYYSAGTTDTVVLGTTEFILPQASILGFIAQIDPNFNIINAQIFEGSELKVTGMGTDSNSNCYITGHTNSNADLNGSDVAGGEITVKSGNKTECFVARFNEDFTIEWAYPVGGVGHQFGGTLVTKEDKIVFSGVSSGINSSVSFYHPDGTMHLGSGGRSSAFFATLNNTNGLPLNHNILYGDDSSLLANVEIGNHGEIIAVGAFQVNLVLDLEGAIPYVLYGTNSNVGSQVKYGINTYVMRLVDYCDPLELVEQPELDQELCGSQSNKYEVNVKGTGVRYQWYIKGIPMSDIFNTDINIYISGSATKKLNFSLIGGLGWGTSSYYCKMANSCGDYMQTDTIKTTYYGQPKAHLVPPETAIIGKTGMITVRVEDDYPDASFQWYKGQNPIFNNSHFSGADTDTLIINNIRYEDAAQYLCLVGSLNCPDDEHTKHFTKPINLNVALTATNNIHENKTIKIFPNPIADEINIDLKNIHFKKASILISDIYGHLLFEKTIDHNLNSKIDVKNYQSGTYIINIITESNNYSQKVIIL